MKLAHPAAVYVIVLLAGGCGGGSPQPAATRKPFLDEKFEVPPSLEWSKEVTAKKGGAAITYRITSQGPLALTIVTEKGYKALTGSDKNAFDKADFLHKDDSTGSSLEGSITLPPGSSYFIIQNRSDQKVEIRLECFPG